MAGCNTVEFWGLVEDNRPTIRNHRVSAVSLVSLLEPENADPSVAATLASGREQYGSVLNTWRALLHRPPIFNAYLPYLRAVLGPGRLSPRIKDLAAITVAIENHCRYSASHRIHAGRANGVTDAELEALAAGRIADFADDEQVAIRFARELTMKPPSVRHAGNPQAVEPGLLAELGETFDEEQIVELTATVALWNALTRFHRVMELPLDMPAPPPFIDAVL